MIKPSAGAVAVLACSLVAACTSSSTTSTRVTSSAPPLSHGTQIACAGPSPSADLRALTARAKAIAPRAQVSVSDGRITVTLPGPPVSSPGQLCARGLLEFRPLVLPPDRVTCRQQCSRDALERAARAAHVAVPTTDTAADRLTAARRHALDAALAKTDCAAVARRSPNAHYTVGCGRTGTSTPLSAYLLGAVIVSGSGIAAATAVAPGSSNGGSGWTIDVRLAPGARAAWSGYTSEHNANGNPSVPPVTNCANYGTPCADYVGFVLDGVVISTPVNLTPISGTDTQISGSFTKTSAHRIASELTGGPLPEPLRVVTIHRLH